MCLKSLFLKRIISITLAVIAFVKNNMWQHSCDQTDKSHSHHLSVCGNFLKFLVYSICWLGRFVILQINPVCVFRLCQLDCILCWLAAVLVFSLVIRSPLYIHQMKLCQHLINYFIKSYSAMYYTWDLRDVWDEIFQVKHRKNSKSIQFQTWWKKKMKLQKSEIIGFHINYFVI